MFELFNICNISQAEYDYYFSLMSDEKKKKVMSFRFEADKKRTVCADMLARKMLGKIHGKAEEDIYIGYDSDGRPVTDIENIFISLSHSGDFSLCAVSCDPVGADIEKIQDVSDAIVRRVCCEDELCFLNQAEDEDERKRRFFEIWTGKEAYFKSGCSGKKVFLDISVTEDRIRKNLKSIFSDGYCISIYEEKKSCEKQ